MYVGMSCNANCDDLANILDNLSRFKKKLDVNNAALLSKAINSGAKAGMCVHSFCATLRQHYKFQLARDSHECSASIT